MLAAMIDAEALEAPRNAIRKLFPPGQARERGLAGADRIQDDESRELPTSWFVERHSLRRKGLISALFPLRFP